MTNTMTCTTTIQMVGYTTIDDTKVVQYTCTMPINKPQDMRITSTRMNPDMYKENRDICRADMVVFEDAAYALQDEYLAKVSE